MKRSTVFVALAATLLLAPMAARADANIRANCTIDSVGARCVFNSTGDTPGSACATMHLMRGNDPSQSSDSVPVCSGMLAPGSSVTLPAAFAGVQPTALCVNEQGAPQLTVCAVQVQMSEVQMPSGSGGGGARGLFSLVVLLSAAWVYTDAKKIGARKGLLPGLFDLNPGGWFVVTLLLWIVGFPSYLAKRGAIRAAALAANGGLPPGYVMGGPAGPYMMGGAPMPPQGFVPPGYGQPPPQQGYGPPGYGPPPGGGFPPQQ